MSQLHSLGARYPKGREIYSTAYSGSPPSPATSRPKPDTQGSRPRTASKVLGDKQSYPTTRSKPRSRSRSGQASTVNPPTERPSISPQKTPYTRQSEPVPLSQELAGDDARSMMSGISRHEPVAAAGAQLDDLSKPNVQNLGASTRRGPEGLGSWFDDSVESAKPKGGFYEVVRYREGLGNRGR
jgi:hypothetical protein